MTPFSGLEYEFCEYCCKILQQLTGIHHEPSVVDLFIHNPVNRRTNTVSLQAVLQQFSSEQRAWYNAMLKEDLPRSGYALDNDDLLKAAGRTPSVRGALRSEPPMEFGGYERVRAPEPTRRRTTPNPLNRGEYLMYLARRATSATTQR